MPADSHGESPTEGPVCNCVLGQEGAWLGMAYAEWVGVFCPVHDEDSRRMADRRREMEAAHV